jgi:1,5-anhydro-D-fructose reductase (1,5-anhydro-D-mannitol-forming)
VKESAGLERVPARSPVRWGMIGCGAVTERKSGPALQLARDSALTAVMSRSLERARDYAGRHGVSKYYGAVDDLLRDEEVDAVYVATPVGSHLEVALRACEYGKPAYIEKPMARNHAECLRMQDAFRAAALPVFVAYYRRRLPRFLRVRELLAGGAIGKPVEVTSGMALPAGARARSGETDWRLNAEHAGGGLAMDMGCHVLDLIDFLIAPLEDVRGTARNRCDAYDVEDLVSFAFRAGDTAGSGYWDFASDTGHDSLKIRGTAGSIAVSVFDAKPIQLTNEQGVQYIAIEDPPHVQGPLIQSVVDDLLGRDRCPSTAKTAARASLALDSMLEGYYGGRQDEFWRRPESWPGVRTRRPG